MKYSNTFVVTVVLFFSSSANATFILEGEHETYNFSPSNFSESITTDNNHTQIQLTFANSFDIGGLEDPHLYNGHLELGESIQVDFYENKADIDPFATHILDGQDPESYAYIFSWQDIFGTGDTYIPWIDLEGSVVITSITGEVEILPPSLVIINNGYTYSGNASISSVPLPPSLPLLFMSLMSLFIFRKKTE